jgi:phage baseplate assembly protein W
MATSIISSPRQYTDLDLNFVVHPIKKDINKNVGTVAVINSIKNLLLTSHFEKPFHPEIGSNMRKMLFEPMDAIVATNIRNEIEQTVNNYEPRARIKTIVVTPNYDENGFSVQMEFFVLNVTQPITISFFLSRVR